MNRRKINQAKLQYWAWMIHDCQHSGLKTKEWLANHGISKDTYYYWYKKVQTICVEAMEIPDTLSMPEFVSFGRCHTTFSLVSLKIYTTLKPEMSSCHFGRFVSL